MDTSEALTIVEKDGDKVAIYGLGGLSEENVKQKLSELKPKPVQGVFSIFMFHQSIYELMPFNDDFIHFSDLPEGFDLYVDGHIHSKVESTVYGKKFLIPGSTVLTQLKEEEQGKKGFFVFDTKSYSYTFEQINSRPFFAKRMQFSNAEPSLISKACDEFISSTIGKSGASVPIIRLILEGTVARGASSADIMLNSLSRKYMSNAILSIDASRLESEGVRESIEQIRESKLGDTPIKEFGMAMLGAKLKELNSKWNNYTELFNMLSSDSSKEKIIKEAMEYIEGIDAATA